MKYLLYAPLAAQVVYSWTYEQDYSRALWCLHILIICGLKGLVHVLWSVYNNMLWVTRTLRINPNGVDVQQIDHEWHWYRTTFTFVSLFLVYGLKHFQNHQKLSFWYVGSYYRDNYIILQAIIASMICYMSPSLIMMNSIPLWNTKGLIALIVIHVTFSEPLYYYLHRSLHRNNYLFRHYHSFHHLSPVPHPMTGKKIH